MIVLNLLPSMRHLPYSLACAGNIGRFDPRATGHNVNVRPFFNAPGGLALFNPVTAYLWFRFGNNLPSMGHAMLPGVHLHAFAIRRALFALLFANA